MRAMALASSTQAAGRSRKFPRGLSYTAFASYRAVSTAAMLAPEDRAGLSAQALQTVASVPQVALRGIYHMSGYSAEADLLLWLAAPAPDALQDGLSAFRQTPLAAGLESVWSAVALHRPPEVRRWGAAAYFQGDSARRYLCVCPINHTAEWHELQISAQRRLESDRDRLLQSAGDVLVNSVSAVGLGAHELIIALEADDVARLSDVVRDLGATEARRYISGPLATMTGVRKPLGEIVDSLP
jgi:chlorite dismutase